MKNFRKVLALILVVATLFSFAAMTSAREVGEYTDNDKISYTEAVDVLTAIGILDGYTDGSFKPTDNIAREEMAKMVAVLSNSGDDVSDLYASACKFADTKDRWSASYVAYCNETGIVAGRNASTFDPRGKVTGIETAKMLLCLIGFDATAQGYVGSNWKTNVLRDAKAIGLLNGFAADYDISKAITLEESAQMMLNALKAPMVVGTVSNNIVNITNNVWLDIHGLNAVSLKGMTLTDAARKYGCWVLYGNVLVSPIKVLTNYKGLSVDVGQDCYGNPVTEWTYKKSNGTVIWSAQYALAPDYSYTKAASLASDLKEEIKNGNYIYTLYVDGYARDPAVVSAANLNAIANAYTGKGVETKVYVDDTDVYHSNGNLRAEGSVIITVKNTYIGKVVDTSNANSKFELADDAIAGLYTETVFSNAKYDFEEGDVILYWICSADGKYNGNYQLHDAELAEPLTVSVDRVNYSSKTGATAADANVTAEGKTYEYAMNLANYVVPTMVHGDPVVEKWINKTTGTSYGASQYNKYDLYFDKFGYIMSWNENDPTVEYGVAYFVPGTLEGTNPVDKKDGTHYTYTADFVGMDGKPFEAEMLDTLRIGTDIEALYDHNDKTAAYGILVSYTMVDGKMDLDAPASLLTNETPDYVGSRTGLGHYLSKRGNIVNLRTGNVALYGDVDTQYLVKVGDTYTAYSYNEIVEDYYVDQEQSWDRDCNYAIQYFFTRDAAGNPTLAYVFIDVKYNVVDSHAFVTSYAYDVSDTDWADKLADTDNAYSAFNAIINGKEAILAVTAEEGNRLDLFRLVEGRKEFVMVEVGLQYAGFTDDNNLPVYTMVNIKNANLPERHSIDLNVGEKYTSISVYDENDKIEDRMVVDADCIFVATYIDADGNRVAEVVTLEELLDIVDDFDSGIAGSYKFDEGWYYSSGSGANKVCTELYVNVNN